MRSKTALPARWFRSWEVRAAGLQFFTGRRGPSSAAETTGAACGRGVRVYRFPAILLAILLLFICGVSQATAKDDQLWGAVLLATNGTPPEPLPSELKPYQQRLERIFGYSTFQVLGNSSQQIEGDREQWLIPGKMFSVRSQVQPTSDSNFQVDLRLYRDKKELVQTVAKLGPRSPLFIRGPLYGNGQLIIAIMVRD